MMMWDMPAGLTRRGTFRFSRRMETPGNGDSFSHFLSVLKLIVEGKPCALWFPP